MTQEEISMLLEMMLNAYPMASKKITNPDATIKAWELAFGDEPADVIYKAARHHMNTNKFFPTVADIRGCINKGQMIYGQERQPAIEAPQKLIAGEMSEESPCRFEHCILYHDLCNGLDENGECPFEGL